MDFLKIMSYKIGIGYDIHKLVEGRKLILGGVEIPHGKGLLGHSDADALIHAICDALLGAISAGDIGELFPDTDPKYKGADSAELLKKVYELLKGKNYEIDNIDSVIIAQEPKLTPFKKEMRRKIAQILKIEEDRIGVKAKTNEGLGEIGKGAAIAAYAVALLKRRD